MANSSPDRPDLSVLLPMYNEAKGIEKCVKEVEEAVKSFSSSYEILIAEDGSNDGTDVIARSLVGSNPRLKHLHSSIRLGKGGAIRSALHVAKGDVVVLLDSDLATKLEHLQQIVDVARQSRGMAIGSRFTAGARVRRPFSRTFLSIVYNLLVRMLFFDEIRDHQCGFKALSNELTRILMDQIESNGFVVDTEMIMRAKQNGFAITEIGVEWTEARPKGESRIKSFHDAWTIGIGLLRLRFRILKERSPPARA